QPNHQPTLQDLMMMSRTLRDEGLAKLAAQLKILIGTPILLCIDQFEQILSILDAEDRMMFLDFVLADQSIGASDFHIVCTLRADFLGQLLEHPGCGSLLQERLWPLSPMTVEELERVITEPAEARGVYYEAGLARQIASDAAGGGGLPLLEFALTELW